MSDWRPFIYGGIASVTAEFGTFPIDTTKTRLQVQGQAIDPRLTTLRYRGMLHAGYSITKEEGFRALYRGLSPALLRQASYGTIKIGIYHSLKRWFFQDPKQETLLPNVFCGIVSGVISSSIANPTDVLKIRMQAQTTDAFNRSSLLRSFMDIAKNEGVAGLWRGVGPTANRAAVVCGVELPAYDSCKKHLILSGEFQDNTRTHFLSSFLAGLLGAIASNPIDVIKTRLMNQRKFKLTSATAATVTTPAVYTGSIDCLVQTCKYEGFLALYKGFIPNWLRLGPWNIIFFITFEKLRSWNKSSEEPTGQVQTDE